MTGQGRPGLAALRRVRIVVLDVDGVLTDGRLLMGPGGEEWKAFHVHDGLAMARVVEARLPLAVVSSRSSPAVALRCAELGVGEVHQGVRDKVAVLERLVRRHRYRESDALGMGDDLADLPLLRRVGLAVAPADAVPDVRRAVRWVTRRPGGAGAVREVLEAVLRARGLWRS